MSDSSEFEANGASGSIATVLAAAWLALFSVSAFGAAHPYAQWAAELGIDTNVSYDGTRVIQVENGTVEATERRAPGKMYTELHMGNVAGGVILREDLGKSFILMPSMGFYREESLEGGMMQTSNGLEFSSIEEAGRESINGHDSTKYRARFTDNDGKGAGFIWVTDTGVPIKMDMIYQNKKANERISMEFVELNLRPQDPQHFELPEGLKPMTMGNMAGLGQLLGRGAGTGPAAGGATPEGPADLASAREKCLQDAMQAARGQQEKKRGLGRLFSAASRITERFGGPDFRQTASDIYAADATAQDLQAAARDLGISEDEIERCKNP